MKPEMVEEEKEPKVNIKTNKLIVKTVQEILETSNLNQVTEKKVREEAAAKLKLDLDLDLYKTIVRHEVQSFLVKAQAQAQQKRAKAQQKCARDDDDWALFDQLFQFPPSLEEKTATENAGCLQKEKKNNKQTPRKRKQTSKKSTPVQSKN